MAQLQAQTSERKNKTSKLSLRIDMTPMVDLGFLLITFFIFTATMAEQKATKLYMPADGNSNLGESSALTFILKGSDSVLWYAGTLQDAMFNNTILSTNYNTRLGIGKVIREKQKSMNKKEELMILIKPSDASTYNNLVNMLDEIVINSVKKYTIVPLHPIEKTL